MSNDFLFQRTATAFTARDIEDQIGPLVPVDANLCSASFYEATPSVVVDGSDPVGWLSSEDLNRAELAQPGSLDNLFGDSSSREQLSAAGGTASLEAAQDATASTSALDSDEFLESVVAEFMASANKDDGDSIVIREIMHPLSPFCVVAPDTTLLECMERFVKCGNSPLVVRDGTDITGIIDYRDFFKPVGRLVLSGIVLDLETAAIGLLQCFQEQCMEMLREQHEEKGELESRLLKMFAMFKARYVRNHPGFKKRLQLLSERARLLDVVLWPLLLASTTFTDKANMIVKCKLLSGPGRDHVNRIFARAERVRNNCFHPTGLEGSKHPDVPDPEIDREKFGLFIRDCRDLIETLVLHTPFLSPYSQRANDY